MLRLKKGFWGKFLAEALEFVKFVGAFLLYLRKRIAFATYIFEKVKNLIVHLFVAKRGRYKRQFLHFGMMALLAIGVVVTPILAETNPLIQPNKALISTSAPSEVLSSITDVNVFQTQISPKPRNEVISYTVEKGDTLSTVADKFGVSTDTIRWANDLTSDTLTIGQEIKIPPVTGIVHKVERGESVYTIANKYDTDAQKIVNFPFNDFANPETFSLVEGQTLVVPDGVKPKAPIRSPRPLATFIAQQPGAGSSAGFIWPTTGGITQYPVWYHNAIDIANKSAPPVLAAKAGKVIFATCQKVGYGCHIIIDHGDGTETLYGHLQRFYISEGEQVSQGEVIGQMGSTGRSTGTHLHFEVRKNGITVNPLGFLK